MRTLQLLIALTFTTLLAHAQTPNWLWAKKVAAGIQDYSNTITEDVNGNFYLIGGFYTPTITFGNITLTNTTNNRDDGFIAKFDHQGNVIWAKGDIATNGYNEVYVSLVTDARGNVYVTGMFDSQSIKFGNITITNASNVFDIFVVKYDSSGNVIWAKDGGGTGDDYSGGIALDAGGNIYITGDFQSVNATFGNLTLTVSNNYNGDNLFVVKYDTLGNAIWARSAGSNEGITSTGGLDIATDSRGNVYVAGVFMDSVISFGNNVTLKKTPNSVKFTQDIFVAKYNSSGTVLWARGAEGTGADFAEHIGADAAGNAYVYGYFQSPFIKLDSIIVNGDTTGKGMHIFNAKYDTLGHVIWANTAGNSNYNKSSGMAVDAAGNSYITGSFYSPLITFGALTLTDNNTRYSNQFITKYDTYGNAQWAINAGPFLFDNAGCTRPDAQGNLYVVGGFRDSAISFGNDTLLNAGDFNTWNIFIAALGDAGVATSAGYVKNGTDNVSVYPNPSNGILSLVSGIAMHGQLTIINLLGQSVYNATVTSNKTIIDLSHHPKGIYFYRLQSCNAVVQTGKIIIE